MTFRTRTHVRSVVLPRVSLVIVVVLALLCGWWALARGFEYAVQALRYGVPLDGQEGMALWEAQLLRSGQPLYQPVVPDRFVSAPYPPFHPLLLALLAGGTQPHVFWAGRLISLIAALVTAVCGLGLVQRVTGSRLAAVAAAVLLLAFPPLQLWALRIKPDMVGLALTLGGLWLVARWQPPQRSIGPAEPPGAAARGLRQFSWLAPSLLLAALAFVVAHFTKQTMLAGPLAAGTYLLLKDRRVAVRWVLVYLILLATTWIALDLITRGQYTYHVWVLHKLEWTGYRFWKLASQLRDAWPLALLGGLALAACRRRPTVINAYALWAPASLIGAGVVGSHHNHLLETGAALALVGAQALGLGLRQRNVLTVLAPVLLATQLLLWRTPLPWFVGEYVIEPDDARFIEFVQATPGEIMADDIGILYAAQRPIRYDDPAAMGPAATLGLWDQRQFVADIRAQRFSAILLALDVFGPDGLTDPSGRWTPEMLQAIRDSYEIKFTDEQLIYVPKGSATP